MTAIKVIRQFRGLQDVDFGTPNDGDAFVYDSATDSLIPHTITAGTGASFTFTQGSPSDTWVITHNLGLFPSVTVVDSGGTMVVPDVLYTDSNHLTITFGSPTSGKAYLN